jgi:hypothetical protein
LFGVGAVVAAAVPLLLLVRLAFLFPDQPMLLPALLVGWCVAAATAARPLFAVAARVVARRRENLGLTV